MYKKPEIKKTISVKMTGRQAVYSDAWSHSSKWNNKSSK